MGTASHNERIGLHEVGAICEKRNWYFRELPEDDIGLDAIIEYTDEKSYSKLIALQIKSGESFFRRGDKASYTFVFDERHKEYWGCFSMPVLIVLYNPITDVSVCGEFSKSKVESAGRGFKMKIGKQDYLGDFLDNKAPSLEKMPPYLFNYNYMLTQLPFLEAAASGKDIVLDSEEWVNKSSGRGEITVSIIDGKRVETYDWPYWFPFTPYDEVFRRLFPWADFTPDDDFYYEDDLEAFHDEDCVYDQEEDQYLALSEETFEQFRERLGGIRGLDRAGEVAVYKLHLTLNDFGKAFLLVNHRLNTMEIYRNVKADKNP